MQTSNSISYGDDRLPSRFWEKVEVDEESGCWIQHAGNNGNGYRRFPWQGKRLYAHRLAYEALVAPIPPGSVLDHLCRNPACVYPGHLEPTSHAENVRRGISPAAIRAAQTHCLRGHEFTPGNTYYRRDTKNGRRGCIACHKMRKAKARCQ